MPRETDCSHKTSGVTMLGLVMRGMLMGVADIIPGVSGGTVAFLTGIYEQLLDSIKSFDAGVVRDIFMLRWRSCVDKISWRFLLPLLTGICFSFVALARVFTLLLNHEVYYSYLYAIFFGLIMASALLCMKLVKKWDVRHILFFVVGAAVAFAATEPRFAGKGDKELYDIYLPALHEESRGKEIQNYDDGMLRGITRAEMGTLVAQGKIPATTPVQGHGTREVVRALDVVSEKEEGFFDIWIMACGSLAICAMLLPGISGSYLLVILGVYSVVIEALADVVSGLQHGEIEYYSLSIVISLAVGCLCGAAFFSRCISWLFSRYRSHMTATLIGCMIGAVRSVWPFWRYEYVFIVPKIYSGPRIHLLNPVIPSFSGHTILAVAMVVVACGAVIALEMIAAAKKAKNTPLQNKK
jgi:putative membrane protein